MKSVIDYIVSNGRIVLVNQVSGRQEPSKHFGHSLHPFIQTKHGLPIEEPRPTIRSITTHSFARQIPILVGMSGTLISEEMALRSLYGGKGVSEPIVVRIPPLQEPKLRRLEPSLSTNFHLKMRSLAEEIIQVRETSQQPILVITSSVKDSEEVVEAFRELCEGQNVQLEFQILNASHEELEEEIISFAGEPGAVTISTQMAARGTDITISQPAVELGGLYVMIEEFQESERLDRQAEGRAARHGDPGASRYFVSYDDAFFGYVAPQLKERLKRWLGVDTSVEIDEDILIGPVRFMQRERQYLYEQWRNQSAEIDGFVDAYRTQAMAIRERFVSDELDDLVEGVAALGAMVRLSQRPYGPVTEFVELADLMQKAIVGGETSTDLLIRQYQSTVAFPLISALFRPIVQAYERQQTPSLTLEPYSRESSLRRAILSAIIKSAKESDLKWINENWTKLERQFGLSSAVRDLRLTDLFAYLNRHLHLQFSWSCWTTAERILENQVLRAPSEAGNLSQHVRKAIIETITQIDPDILAEGVERFGLAIGGESPTSVDADTELPSGQDKEEVPDMAVQARAVFATDAHQRATFCKAVLSAFDDGWIEALDQIYLIEQRVSREQAQGRAWSTLVKEVGKVFRGFFEALSADVHRLMEEVSGGLGIDSFRTELRFLPADASGSYWILSHYEGDKFEIDSELIPQGYAAYLSRMAQQNGNAEAKSEWDEFLDEEGDQSLPAFSSGEFQGNRLQDMLRHIELRRRRQSALPPLDVLLQDDDVGNRNIMLDEEELLAQAAYLFYTSRDALFSLTLLDQVEDEEKTARLRAQIYEAFGCRQGELTHLRQLAEQGHLSLRLRLRMTYLLASGDKPEQRSALRILAEEAVPNVHDDLTEDGYTPLMALQTAVGQMNLLQAYDEAILLLSNRLELVNRLHAVSFELFDVVGESFGLASDEARHAFEVAAGEAWRDWLDRFFLDLFHVYRHDDDRVRWRFQDWPKQRVLLRIALYMGRRDHAAFMIKEIIRTGGKEEWFRIASVFEECGYQFDAELCKARFFLIGEQYEETLKSTDWLLARSQEIDVVALHIEALAGLSRVLSEHLYGRNLAYGYLNDCYRLLEALPEAEQKRPYVPELILEVLCLSGNLKAAKQRVLEEAQVASRWRVHALLNEALESIPSVQAIEPVLESIGPEGYDEELEACQLVVNWLGQLRFDNTAVWCESTTFDVLCRLYNRFQSLPGRSSGYQAYWQLGNLAHLQGSWLIDTKAETDAREFLRRAVELWRRSLELTRASHTSYLSILKRHEILHREVIEESLRRCLQQIKIFDIQHNAERATDVSD